MSNIQFKPIGHFVLVEMVEVQNTTKSGIILGGTAKEQAATQIGKVVAIGSTAFIGVAGCNPLDYSPGDERYKLTPAQLWGVSVGDLVYYDRYEGQQVKFGGHENHRLISDITIKATVTGDIEISKTDF